ncbi:hypothetical protein GIB67_012806 [Kingdonia uniflora]|uniref:RRM domain-containing protein n=1 Tax=Kingdonia uniflora TaxID=39325 RepID=A0A7J7NF96_9MAGN|nr:hypothetical protein GIB67_012806 [Kingdonia uniflora]
MEFNSLFSTTTTTQNPNFISPIKTLIQHQLSVCFSIKINLNSSKFQNVLKISSIWNPNFPKFKPSSSAVYATTSETLEPITTSKSSSNGDQEYWLVVMDKPLEGGVESSDYRLFCQNSCEDFGGGYNEKEAQMCIYDESWEAHFGFCCHIDEDTSTMLVRLPEVLSVRPDIGSESADKDYSVTNLQFGRLSSIYSETFRLFPEASSKYWLVQMDKPSIQIVTKAQMVDHYAQILAKVLAKQVLEKDAQICIYDMSWQNYFGFCCELGEECARELASVPGVLSVQLDENFASENKVYGGILPFSIFVMQGSCLILQIKLKTFNIKTKWLFVTGLSFYTSEKTLCAAFKGFGELVEEYLKGPRAMHFWSTLPEEVAGVALKEMNDKIINGWMIVVDVAKTNPPKYNKDSLKKPTV